MKLPSLLSLLLASTSFVSSFHTAHARHGGSDRGGGEVPKSTKEQIQAAIDLAPTRLRNFVASSLSAEMPIAVQEAFRRFSSDHKPVEINELTKRPKTNLEWALEHTQIQLVEGSCQDQTHEMVEKEATVAAFVWGSPICMSLQRLKRLPQTSLDRNISGLVVHELVHQAGIRSDRVASQVQIFVSRHISEDRGTLELECKVTELKDSRGNVERYQVDFPSAFLDCTGGCGTGYSFDAEELGTALPMLRTSFLGKKMGRDGGCTSFKFK